MKLILHRTYFPEGTVGILEWNCDLICYTIELPWLENQRGISCVPEGEYVLKKRFSQKFQWHLVLENVIHRDLILLHSANDAQKELKGCIAPVTFLTGIAQGAMSRKALLTVKNLAYKELNLGKEVRLHIQEANGIFCLKEYQFKK